MVARNSGAVTPSQRDDSSQAASSSFVQGQESFQDNDSIGSSRRNALGDVTAAANNTSPGGEGPKMTVYHFNQEYSPGCEDITMALYDCSILYMPGLSRILAGEGYQHPSELGLTRSQMDVCQMWIDLWRKLPASAEEDIEKVRKDIRHLTDLKAKPFDGTLCITSSTTAGADLPLTPPSRPFPTEQLE